MIEWMNVPVPIFGGIDNNTDPKRVAPPRVLEMENGTFRTPGSVEKRPGFDLLAIGDPVFSPKDIRGIASRGEELVVFDGDRIFRKSESIDGYITAPRISGSSPDGEEDLSLSSLLRIRRYPISEYDAGNVFGTTIATDVATGFVAATAKWFSVVGQTKRSGGNYQIRYLVIDEHDGSVIYGPVGVATPAAPCLIRVVSVNVSGVQCALVIYSDGANNLKCLQINQTNFRNPVAAGVTTIATDVSAGAFDVEVRDTGVYYVYVSTTANTVKFGKILGDGTSVIAPTAQATAAAPIAVCIAINQYDGDFALAWASTAGSRVDGRVFNSAGTALGAAFQIEATGGLTFNQITAVYEEETAAYTSPEIGVFYSVQGAARSNDLVKSGRLKGDGSGGTAGGVYVRHVGISSRAWRMPTRKAGQQSNNFHLVLSRSSALQPTYFVYRVNVKPDGGTTGSGKSTPKCPEGYIAHGSAWDHSLGATGLLSGVHQLGGISRWVATDGSHLSEYRMDDGMPLRSVDVDGVLHFAGGFVGAYEGQTSIETSPLLYPEIITLTPSNGAGALTPAAIYTYRVYYTRFNGMGKKIISGTIQKTVTMGGADDTVDLVIESLAQLLPGIGGAVRTSVEIYRGLGNSAGVICRLVARIANSPTTDTVTYTDLTSDATLASQPQDYMSGTPTEFQNYAPHACTAIALVNGRVWINQVEDDNLILFSKERLTGEPLAFAGENRIVLQAGSGPVTAISQIRDTTIIFREREIYSVAGRGPDNTGGDGQYDDPILITNDVGCINPESVVYTQVGVFFESHKGIMLLSSEGTVELVGAPVLGFKGEVISRAILSATENEVYFLGTTRTLAYDLDQKAWHVWTITGEHACVWQERLCFYKASTGKIYSENKTVYMDEATTYTFKLVTPWIALEGLNGAQRIRRALVQGALLGSHRGQLWFAFDNVETYYGPFTWTSIAASKYNFAVFAPQQRCTSVKIKIQDLDAITGSPPGASLAISEFALEAARQKSPVRLPIDRMGT